MLQKPLFGDKVYGTAGDTYSGRKPAGATGAAGAAAATMPAAAPAPARAKRAPAPEPAPAPASDIGERFRELFAQLAAAPALDSAAVREIVNGELAGEREVIRALADGLLETRAQLEALAKPRPAEFHVYAAQAVRTIKGKPHAQYAAILRVASSRNRHGFHPNILICGPAGSGKTHVAAQLAEALGYNFGFISLSAGLSEAHLTGRYIPIGAGGAFEYVPAGFVTAYRDGGLFLLDELDAADGNVMVAVNAALANGRITLPDGAQVTRHPDSLIIAAANTWGYGADRQYAGRNQLDAATLDRFAVCKFYFDYDADLEREDGDAQVVEWFHAVRETIKAAGLRRIVSTRAIFDASDLVRAGAATFSEIKERFTADWTPAERAKLPDAA